MTCQKRSSCFPGIQGIPDVVSVFPGVLGVSLIVVFPVNPLCVRSSKYPQCVLGVPRDFLMCAQGVLGVCSKCPLCVFKVFFVCVQSVRSVSKVLLSVCGVCV